VADDAEDDDEYEDADEEEEEEEEESDEEEEEEDEEVVAVQVDKEDSESYDEMLVQSPMSNMGVTLGVMMLTRKLDLSNKKVRLSVMPSRRNFCTKCRILLKKL